VASTFPGLYLVEKMGRRNLLLMGAIGMAVCQFIVAITGTVAGTDDLPAQRAAIAFVCIYIFVGLSRVHLVFPIDMIADDESCAVLRFLLGPG
jgi:nitrate/nitrite transporter NarK